MYLHINPTPARRKAGTSRSTDGRADRVPVEVAGTPSASQVSMVQGLLSKQLLSAGKGDGGTLVERG